LRPRYPFEFLDPEPGTATARARLSATSASQRHRADWSPFLLFELLAQATFFLKHEGETPVGLPQLAGIEDGAFTEALEIRPLQAGDVVDLFLTVEARLGKLLKVRGRAERDAQKLVEGVLLLALG
jgi:hypothetical protein